MRPLEYLREVYSVAWGDLVYIKENLPEVLVTGLVGPLLYLLAFGYGVGGSMQGGGEEYVRFILPGIIALTTVACTFSSVSMRVLVQRLFYMSFDELLLCPVRVSSVILGKTLSGVVRSLISCTVLLIVGCIISPGIDPNPLIFLVIIAGGLMFSMFGLLAALVTNKTQHLTLITSIFIVPMTFLCGTLFKVSDLPDVVSWAVYVLPLTHISELSRGILLDEGIPLDSIVMVAIYLCLFFFLCYRRIATRRNRPGTGRPASCCRCRSSWGTSRIPMPSWWSPHNGR
jgi:ABC-type multidrug transport system permease subunit